MIPGAPYCIHPDGKWYSLAQAEWERGSNPDYGRGFWNFVNFEEWSYNFEAESFEALNKGFHYEALPLSRMALGHLLTRPCLGGKPFESFRIQSYNEMKLSMPAKNSGSSESGEMLVHFDVMNNWKPHFAIGKQAIENGLCDELCELRGRYHTIGNFAPIPWPENLQAKHAQLSERWDELLRYCHDNWDKWRQGPKSDIAIGFTAYMKLSCQQMYYSNIAEEALALADISDRQIINQLSRWDSMIDDGSAGNIVTFNVNEGIGDTLRIINKLIEIRGRCIIALLRAEYLACEHVEARSSLPHG